MATSSSAQKTHHHLNHLYNGGGSTSAPPPTPSTQPSLSSTSDSAAADTLSRLLHRLPPNLSLPTRLSPRAAPKSTTPLPTLSSLSSTSPTIFELGYFQLSHHAITPQLAESAESDSLSLFELPLDEKLSSFPSDWPLGFNYDDGDDDHQSGSFCLDGPSLDASTEVRLTSLKELTHELEKQGLEVVERLASSVGFSNPFREGGVGPKHSSLMWVTSSDGDQAERMYPYVVGMQYQMKPRKWTLLSDSGSVNVEPQVGSVLVTLGDIAQVWSNGKLKKVRGRPTPVSDDGTSRISMTLLLTLPLESAVSPILIDQFHDHNNRKKEACIPEINHKKEEKGGNVEDIQNIEASASNDNNNNDNGNDEDEDDNEADHQRVFNSFSFEDYAWRVYHDERQLLKDPLNRYRVMD